jgi:hypothetical protein
VVYLDAAGKKSSLLLDITNPRVYVEDNVFVKATMVQKYVKTKLNKEVPILCVTGRGMKYRISTQHPWAECEGVATVYEALAMIEGTATHQIDDAMRPA